MVSLGFERLSRPATDGGQQWLDDTQEAVDKFPEQELQRPYRPRGPIIQVDAIRALARATGRRTRLRPRELPRDRLFDALVDGGLIDERGRLSDIGFGMAQVMAAAPVRVRMHASAAAVPLIFEAHLFGDRALIMATESPSDFLAKQMARRVARQGRRVVAAGTEAVSKIGLELDSVSRLPVAMARWAGVRPSVMAPDQREYTAGWDQVQARFGDAGQQPADLTDSTGPIWWQTWRGWAISTEPATSTMTVVQAGDHNYRLSRPDRDTAHLSWLPPEEVWNRLVRILRGAIAEGAPQAVPSAF